MIIYSIEQDHNTYQYVVPSKDADADRILELGSGPMGEGWTPPAMEIDKACRKNRAGDFWHFGSPPLFVNDNAQRCLAPLLGKHVEFLPLRAKGLNLSVINVLTALDCIDKAASGWGSDEYAFENPVFIPKKIGSAPVFVWRENPALLYVQHAFKDCVEAHGLLGLCFKEEWRK